MQLDPRQALVTIKIKFRRPLSLQQLESAIERIKNRIRDQDPTMERIFIEPDSSAEATRDKMDAA